MTLTTPNPGLDPIHMESGINMFIIRNGTSLCQHIPVTDVPSEKFSKWSTPMWAKNIIPNVVWTDGDIFLSRTGIFTFFSPYFSLTLTKAILQILSYHPRHIRSNPFRLLTEFTDQQQTRVFEPMT